MHDDKIPVSEEIGVVVCRQGSRKHQGIKAFARVSVYFPRDCSEGRIRVKSVVTGTQLYRNMLDGASPGLFPCIETDRVISGPCIDIQDEGARIHGNGDRIAALTRFRVQGVAVALVSSRNVGHGVISSSCLDISFRRCVGVYGNIVVSVSGIDLYAVSVIFYGHIDYVIAL